MSSPPPIITHGDTQWARLCGALGLDADTARYEDVLAARGGFTVRNINRLPRVYVASSYTHGDVAQNVRAAILCGDWLAERGCVPFVPHLSHLWHTVSPHSYQFWIKQDLAWLRVCDALVRLPGKSQGADGEVAQARELGLPVFMLTLDETDYAGRLQFAKWREGWGK